jgi:hypothetical protein
MILSPDDHRSLQAIDGELATCEPHLAAMFRIFSRLNAEEDPPPSEDLIIALPSPAGAPADAKPRPGCRGPRGARARLSARVRAGSGPGGRAGRARAGRWRPVAAIAVPAVLLVTVVMMIIFGPASSLKCRPAPAASRIAARSAEQVGLAQVVQGVARLPGCQPTTGPGKTAGGGNR